MQLPATTSSIPGFRTLASHVITQSDICHSGSECYKAAGWPGILVLGKFVIGVHGNQEQNHCNQDQALHAPGVARCVLRAVALRARCSIGFAVRLEGRECRKTSKFRIFSPSVGGHDCAGGRRESLGKYKSEARVAGGDPKTTWR